MNEVTFRPIAHIHTDFDSKFGIPRQSGIVEALTAEIVFEPEFRSEECISGIEEYNYLWLIWNFSANNNAGWKPIARPSRTDSSVMMGVFATRSPMRPNPVGLSSVRLLEVIHDSPDGPILRVGGADLMNGTPIFDIKPYVDADIHSDAWAAHDSGAEKQTLRVVCDEALLSRLPEEKRPALLGVLAESTRSTRVNAPEEAFSLRFAGHEILYRVENDVLTVTQLL